MPIKGTIFATKNQSRVETMKVGQEGYVYDYDIIVTRKGVFIDVATEVFLERTLSSDEDDDEENDSVGMIPIKRIGPGMTSQDFELDFTGLEHQDYLIYLETEATYRDLVNIPNTHILFAEAVIEIKDSLSQGRKTPLQKKKDELQNAIDNQDYDQAAKLRDEIANLEKKKH